ncbi:hypothetical protein A3467_12170 [Enterobacter roggenkampii]|nr:hypothetical protein A3467_12170 [Enterobacter roggenkampii]
MRKIIQPFGRIAYACAFKTIQNFSPRGLFAHPTVQGEHFIELFFQAVQRVKRHHRLLEDHRDFVAANAAQGLFVGVQQRTAVKKDIPLRVAHRRRRQQPQDGERRNALA